MSTINKLFIDKVIDVSKRLGIEPKHLLAVMKLESGLNTVARNRETNAIGLIQFMPNTAASLGTTTSYLCMMNPVQQMEYVEKYLQIYKPIKDLVDLYLCILLPGARKSTTQNYIENKGAFSWAYEPNKGLDYDRDGVISHKDLSNLFEKVMQGNLWDECMSYIDQEPHIKWPIFTNDPLITPVQNIMKFLRKAAEEKWSLSHHKEDLASLISRGVDGDYAKYVVTWKTNCATSALGFIASACDTLDNINLIHPVLAEKSEMGTSVSRLVHIAQEKISLMSPSDPSKIRPGCLLWYCTPGKNDDHFEWLLSNIDHEGCAEHGGGGRPDNAITISTGNVLTSFGRPLHKYIDVDCMLKDLPNVSKVDASTLEMKDEYAKESVVISTKTGSSAWLPKNDAPSLLGLNRNDEPTRFSVIQKTKNVVYLYALVSVIIIFASYFISHC